MTTSQPRIILHPNGTSLTEKELLSTYNTYRKLRKAIGILGMGLPIILIFATPVVTRLHQGGALAWELETSMSAYYYTKTGGVFVGTIFAIGILLLSYNFRTWDTIITTLASMLAIAVALFPTPEFPGQVNVVGVVHYISAFGLFTLFFVMATFRFTKPDISVPNEGWDRRRKLYAVCGWIIFAMLVVAGICWLYERVSGEAISLPLVNNNWLFWVELVMVEAFGLSWLVKGGYFFFGPFRTWLSPDPDKHKTKEIVNRLPGVQVSRA